MKDKRLHKFIAITLCVTLLTISASRVTRVSAIGTTAAIAATAFILTGAVYMSYVALTQGEMVLPAADELHSWLGGVGRKVSQYPSGSEAYQDIYQQLLKDPTANVIDGVWTWTQDRLKAFANDFSNTDMIAAMTSYLQVADPLTPINGYEYSYPMVNIPPVNSAGLPIDASWLYTGSPVVYGLTNGTYYLAPTLDGTYRNLKLTNGFYVVQQYVNDTWTTINRIVTGGREPNNGRYLNTGFDGVKYYYDVSWYGPSALQYGESDIPLMPFELIHDQATDEDLPLVIPEPRTQLPTWTDPDNENRPIIPWVPIPDIPTGVPVPPGYTAPPQWGFPLQDLLDLLEELARNLINIGAIGELINRFAGQHGDEYYLYYTEGDNNYYSYYQPTIYDNDTEYVTYNINVSEADEHLPVDLNTIELYTHNRYLDEVRRSALAGGSIIRDLTVFWYDVDPTIVYIFFGSCIAILVAAFIGKWGHS